MKLTDREEAVIKVLLDAKHGVTASELSSALNVSSKTVYRTVSAINEKYCHHVLIKSKIGLIFVSALLTFVFMVYFRY
ncbi:helix-turn-helix domain-containing protein [Lactococcus paracarnosus]|uniref:Helix-turn-helix domain-containing protein n=1 Tax=Pseudolactococcus paracarnosus TaxID=2749962 RepID=A0ABT0ALW4_9LACT|nr:helix-turn-helix domain-containing protein [Lactococcus paracarnosus]MCJ1977561.1 helix-turn-helix domain-containing protein [Lactococcus paracarnosus]MCJ1983704.1 helix-turn-helix domain-containing protein [Lactococcus paracarnosus]MCJ1998348.1 helix-turn-helix domain-containing protein [Lactococcus paracarnosus]